MAAAGRGRLHAARHPLLQAQAHPEHLRGVQGRSSGDPPMTFSKAFVEESVDVLTSIDTDMVEQGAEGLAAVRERDGRLFILGVGGSAGHASHAVNDFRKICGFEAYTPTDNVSELTTRVNDEGWDTTFTEWLKGSRLAERDALLVFSVGGGNAEKGV